PLAEWTPLTVMRSLPLPSWPLGETGQGPDRTSNPSRSERKRRGPLGNSLLGGAAAAGEGGVGTSGLPPRGAKLDATAEPRHNSHPTRNSKTGRRQDSGSRPRRQAQLVMPYQANPASRTPPVKSASSIRAAGALLSHERPANKNHRAAIPPTSAAKKRFGRRLCC